MFDTPVARIAFVLGLALGSVLTVAATRVGRALDGTGNVAAVAAAGSSAPLDAWHRNASRGDLEQAMQLSLGRVGAPSAPGRVMPVVASSGDSTLDSLLARAEEHRRQRQFDRACELYAQVAARGAMTADAWADYADAQASLAGRLSGAPARAIEAALALDPRHAKALWLAASLAHEERRYQEALATWRRLLAVVPAESTDARIVEANIAEATRLAAG